MEGYKFDDFVLPARFERRVYNRRQYWGNAPRLKSLLKLLRRIRSQGMLDRVTTVVVRKLRCPVGRIRPQR